jgi:AraC family transcriptional regulator, arabinose operon regulatory protein
MPAHAAKRRNVGAYTTPFSGVGTEFLPLGIPPRPEYGGIVLLEAGYLKYNRRWRFPSMLSPFWRLYYDLRPGHKVIFAGTEVALGPDRIVLIPPHILFHCSGDPPVPTVWLHFGCDRRLAPDQLIPVELSPSPAELGMIKGIIELYQHDSQQAEQPERERIFRLSLALLLEVAARREIQWTEATPEWLLRTLRHIESHLTEPLYLPALAGVAGKNEVAFRRGFWQYLGQTPARFIAEMRVREAAHLLLSADDLTCEQIAERLGFPTASYFSRLFLRVTGERPLSFRQTHRHSEF